MMKNVVSFSLWGSSEVYLRGAVDAIAQVNQYYPGWEARFYLGADVPQSTRQTLIDRGAAIFDGPPWGPWAGMFWRFLAASDPEVDVMISRDVDTRILPREVEAVNEWLASGKTLHFMRDHPKHEMPIMGGMWGCRASHLREMESLILKWKKFGKYGCDQEFLGRIIYPRFQSNSWIHSECIVFPGESIHQFPTKRHGTEYIGSALRDGDLISKHDRYMLEWTELGNPIDPRPHPWSFRGRVRFWYLVIRHKIGTLLKH
jgi:hypothetical protein